eukprot:1036056-Pelagomonas_calceolata.AAC.2
MRALIQTQTQTHVHTHAHPQAELPSANQVRAAALLLQAGFYFTAVKAIKASAPHLLAALLEELGPVVMARGGGGNSSNTTARSTPASGIGHLRQSGGRGANANAAASWGASGKAGQQAGNGPSPGGSSAATSAGDGGSGGGHTGGGDGSNAAGVPASLPGAASAADDVSWRGSAEKGAAYAKQEGDSGSSSVGDMDAGLQGWQVSQLAASGSVRRPACCDAGIV